MRYYIFAVNLDVIVLISAYFLRMNTVMSYRLTVLAGGTVHPPGKCSGKPARIPESDQIRDLHDRILILLKQQNSLGHPVLFQIL